MYDNVSSFAYTGMLHNQQCLVNSFGIVHLQLIFLTSCAWQAPKPPRSIFLSFDDFTIFYTHPHG